MFYTQRYIQYTSVLWRIFHDMCRQVDLSQGRKPTPSLSEQLSKIGRLRVGR